MPDRRSSERLRHAQTIMKLQQDEELVNPDSTIDDVGSRGYGTASMAAIPRYANAKLSSSRKPSERMQRSVRSSRSSIASTASSVVHVDSKTGLPRFASPRFTSRRAQREIAYAEQNLEERREQHQLNRLASPQKRRPATSRAASAGRQKSTRGAPSFHQITPQAHDGQASNGAGDDIDLKKLARRHVYMAAQQSMKSAGSASFAPPTAPNRSKSADKLHVPLGPGEVVGIDKMPMNEQLEHAKLEALYEVKVQESLNKVEELTHSQGIDAEEEEALQDDDKAGKGTGINLSLSSWWGAMESALTPSATRRSTNRSNDAGGAAMMEVGKTWMAGWGGSEEDPGGENRRMAAATGE